MKYETSFPAPVPSPSQLLCRVVAASVNPCDFKLRKHPVLSTTYRLPKVPGSDFAGLVLRAPAGSPFKEGDRVFGLLPILGSSFGSYASLCAVDQECVALAPDGVPLESLAAVGLVACTVLQALRPVIECYGRALLRGKKILITAASGGVGTFATQYCHNVLGMHVAVTVSPRNFELMAALGASDLIDYHTERLEDRVKDFDVFLDLRSHENERRVFAKGARVLRRRGHPPAFYINVAASPYGDSSGTDAIAGDSLGWTIPEARLDRVAAGFFRSGWSGLLSRLSPGSEEVRYHFVLVEPEAAALVETAEAMAAGLVRAVVQETIPMAEAKRAHELIETGHVVGKLVLVNE